MKEKGDGGVNLDKTQDVERYHYSFKIVLVGDAQVGKTRLIQVDEDAHDEKPGTVDMYKRTIAIDFRIKMYEIDDLVYQVEFWDCPGAHRAMLMVNQYCAGAAGILYVFDVTRRETFENISKWMDVTRHHHNHCTMMLVGNKPGLYSNEERAVAFDEASHFANTNSMHYVECTAVTAQNVNQVFETMLGMIVDRLPSSRNPQELMGKNIHIGRKVPFLSPN